MYIGEQIRDNHVTVRLSGHTCAQVRRLKINLRTPGRRKRARKKTKEERRQVNHSVLAQIRRQSNIEIYRKLKG